MTTLEAIAAHLQPNCNPTIAPSPSTFEPLKVFSFPLQDPVKAFAISHKLDFLSHIALRDTVLLIYARRVETVRKVENRRDPARLNRVSIAFERRRDHDRAADRAKSRFEKITAAQGREPAKTSNC